MNWFLWFLAGWFLLGGVITVGQVGKPRKPVDAATAAFVILIDALLIAGLVLFGAK